LAKRVSKKQNQALIARERGLNVTDQQIAQFRADRRDTLIVEAFLNGKVKVDDVAQWTDIDKATVQDRLLDPVRASWIAKQMDALVGTRLGMVTGALFSRAVASGDPSASRLLYEQYGKLRSKDDAVKKSLNINMNVDYTQFTLEQLEKMAKMEARKLGLTLNDSKTARETVEAEFTPSDIVPRPTDSGTEQEAASGRGDGGKPDSGRPPEHGGTVEATDAD